MDHLLCYPCYLIVQVRRRNEYEERLSSRHPMILVVNVELTHIK